MAMGRLLIILHILLAEAPAQIIAAAAANVRFAMEDLRAEFRKTSGIEVTAVYGASGLLATQIRNGAPFHVLVSADMEFPDSLHAWGYAAARPRPYAHGKLVLWTTGPWDLGKGLAVLADTGISRIALADPRRAPYGRAAMEAIRKAGLGAALQSKLVLGESVSQAGQYVLTGNADIGICALSMVMAEEAKGRGRWIEVDSAAYGKIIQGAVLCRHGMQDHAGESKRFLAFLHSDAARRILSRHGYGLPGARPGNPTE